jgi:hypothetical protein
MSNFNDTATNMSVEDWSEIMNGVPSVTFEPFDKVEVTKGGGVTAISFINTMKENKIKTDRQILLESLANSDQPFKYIVMGRNDEYHEIGHQSLRPFGTIREAIAYGEKLTTRDSHGYRSYHSFVIQPLFKDINSFELTSDHIDMICEFENSSL